MIDKFTRLICGDTSSPGSFSGIAAHIQSSLKGVVAEILTLPQQNNNQIALYGPFLGRSVLELGYTALIGRLDPFRLLVLRETQMRMRTNNVTVLGERCQTAIQWTGDIKPAKDGENPDLWSPAKTMDKMHRSLFGKCYEEVFWTPAFLCIIDSLNDTHQGEWFDELRRTPPESFTPRFKGASEQTYSSLSKGIHHEFIIPPDKFYSPEIVFDLLKDAFRLTSHLALVCHAVPTCQCKIPLTEAMDLYDAVQNIESTLCLPTPSTIPT